MCEALPQKVAIGASQTAVFTLPNGVKVSIHLDDGALFVHAGSDDSRLRAGARFTRNCGNEGWIEIKVLPAIQPAKLEESSR